MPFKGLPCANTVNITGETLMNRDLFLKDLALFSGDHYYPHLTEKKNEVEKLNTLPKVTELVKWQSLNSNSDPLLILKPGHTEGAYGEHPDQGLQAPARPSSLQFTASFKIPSASLDRVTRFSKGKM